MSSEVAIRVQNLSKCYQIYERPQDRLKQALWRGRRTYYREFWALRDASFEVRRGETVGIIGRNGSGKSTLLQMICGTLTPTSGEASVRGRVAALLELGSGFNPEFTGRENVYMNAAILGLTKTEVNARYPAIVEFADIGEFVDQPVKTYSSGMFVRLAFAVAVHADPDVLVVDEALAVGDVAFQAKCMSRMRALMEAGVTLLFVSHDIGAVKALCRRALLLDHGRVLAQGDTEHVADEYTRLIHQRPSVAPNLANDATERPAHLEVGDDAQFQRLAKIQRMGNNRVQLLNVQVFDASGRPCESFRYGQTLSLRMVARVYHPVPMLAFGYHVRDRNGLDVLYSDSLIEGGSITAPEVGATYVIDWSFRLSLRNGQYNIACVVSSPDDSAHGPNFTCHDLVLGDFVAVAAQLTVFGDTILHGFVHLDNQLKVASLGSTATAS